MKPKRLFAAILAACAAFCATPSAYAVDTGLSGIHVGAPTLTLEEGPLPEPQESRVNTVELMLVDDTLLACLDGEVLATVHDTAASTFVAGMSGSHTLWFTVDGGPRHKLPLDAEKPVDFNIRGAIRSFATDPTMAAESVTVTGGSQLGALRLTHDGEAVLWGGVATLTLSNGATAVAHAPIGAAYLHGEGCLLVMGDDASCAIVHTGHPGRNLEANGRVTRIEPL